MNDAQHADGSASASESQQPRVSVHMLSESVFCHRAALLGAELNEQEDEVPDSPPRWDYVPPIYSEFELLRRIQNERATRFVGFLLAGVIGIVALLLWGRVPLWLTLSLGCLASLSLGAAVRRLKLLQDRYAAWANAQPNEPAVPLTEPVPVSWWELRRAGFEAISYDAMLDEKSNLEGRPWRVLRRGRQRVPVVRSEGLTREVHPKYLARVAAHCHLLETRDGGESPYGVVLFRHGYEGVAIPNIASNRRLFLDALQACRALLRGDLTADPAPVNHCTGCPRGYPRELPDDARFEWINGRLLTIYAAVNDEGERFHSTCGNRFHWIPPHARSSFLELEPE